MLAATTSRVERNTAPVLNARFERQLQASIARCRHAGPRALERRLDELDREWTVERVIEVEAPATILLGVALGALVDRRWLALSAFAASMVAMHNVQGWYPLLPLLRRLGLRSQQEIERERSALRALRGDQAAWQGASVH